MMSKNVVVDALTRLKPETDIRVRCEDAGQETAAPSHLGHDDDRCDLELG